MALPTAYLTSTKNLEAIFNAIQSAKAPPKFTQRFLEDLGFKSAADRLVINMLKSWASCHLMARRPSAISSTWIRAGAAGYSPRRSKRPTLTCTNSIGMRTRCPVRT